MVKVPTLPPLDNPEGDEPEVWTPRHEFDIDAATAKQFEAVRAKYMKDWDTGAPLPPLDIETGWVEVGPLMAENLLRRNSPHGNRVPVFSHIQMLCQAIRAGDWQKTGQAILLDTSGRLIDGQHRAWAILFAGTAITSFVITGIPHGDNMFAYIDNSKSRSTADALQTAGYNGVSPTIAAIIQLALNIDSGAYTASSVSRRRKLQPAESLRVVPNYPNVEEAARLAHSDYSLVSKLIESKKNVGYLAMRIMDLYDRETCDKFMSEIVDRHGKYEDAGAIMGFRHLMAVNAQAKRATLLDEIPAVPEMKRHQILGNLIVAFNYWIKNEMLPRKNPWMQVPGKFPEVEKVPLAVAAE